METGEDNGPRKRRQCARACQNCAKRKTACDNSRPCRRCRKFGLECLDVPLKRKSGKPAGAIAGVKRNAPTTPSPTTAVSKPQSPNLILEQCIERALSTCPLPAARLVYGKRLPFKMARPTSLFINRAACELLGMSLTYIQFQIRSGSAFRWIHPDCIYERTMATLKASSQRASSFTFNGKYMRRRTPPEGYDGPQLFSAFHATEVVHLEYFPDSPFISSVLVFMTDIEHIDGVFTLPGDKAIKSEPAGPFDTEQSNKRQRVVASESKVPAAAPRSGNDPLLNIRTPLLEYGAYDLDERISSVVPSSVAPAASSHMVHSHGVSASVPAPSYSLASGAPATNVNAASSIPGLEEALSTVHHFPPEYADVSLGLHHGDGPGPGPMMITGASLYANPEHPGMPQSLPSGITAFTPINHPQVNNVLNVLNERVGLITSCLTARRVERPIPVELSQSFLRHPFQPIHLLQGDSSDMVYTTQLQTSQAMLGSAPQPMYHALESGILRPQHVLATGSPPVPTSLTHSISPASAVADTPFPRTAGLSPTACKSDDLESQEERKDGLSYRTYTPSDDLDPRFVQELDSFLVDSDPLGLPVGSRMDSPLCLPPLPESLHDSSDKAAREIDRPLSTTSAGATSNDLFPAFTNSYPYVKHEQ